MPPRIKIAAATAAADTLIHPPPPQQKAAKKKGPTKSAMSANSKLALAPQAPTQNITEMVAESGVPDLEDEFPAPALLAPKITKRKIPQNNDSDFEPETAPTKRRRNPPKVNPRSPRPVREGRVKNPGAPDMPNKVRSSAEVAEVKRRKTQNLKEREALHASKVAEYAQMEIDEEEADAEHESFAIKNLADLEMMDTFEYAALMGNRFDDEAGEILDNFQPSDDVPYGQDLDIASAIRAGLAAVSDPDSEREPSPEPVSKPTKPAKKGKGAIREEVGAVKEKIRSKTNDKRLEKIQALFPTGLNPDWRKRIASQHAGRSTSGGSEMKMVPQQASLGGFSEDDVSGIRPATKVKAVPVPGRLAIAVQGKQRNQNRVNDRVVFVVSDDDAPEPSSRALAAPKEKLAKKSEPRPKLEPQSSITIVGSTPTPAPANDPDGIPTVVAARWDSMWIPTLNSLFGSRHNPFEVADEDIEYAFVTVYPGVNYDLRASGNRVMRKSKDRLNNGRSWFATQAFTVVCKYLHEMYDNTPVRERKTAIASYVEYALRPHGPMIFGQPESEFLAPDDPDYESGAGMCESQFVIAVFSAFVKKTANSAIDYGFLISGLALSAAALEKVFLMYKTGEFVNDKMNFSRENVGALVDDYVANIKKFAGRKWGVILGLCGAAVNPAPTVSAPSMEVSRRTLYVSSSPVKGDD
ncbi:hypothetical protein C8R45DRAFT_1224605 [Mycena sanguinolenta]|nr:hypothetical protein C8R45DRAFT_1224605 [Mycena sanguinolenta]